MAVPGIIALPTSMSEREPEITEPVLDAERIARTLGAKLQHDYAGEPELLLENPISGLQVRLTLHPTRSAVSFYVRVGPHFGGFLHVGEVQQMELKPEQREVHFVTRLGERWCRFAITAQGQVLALANVSEGETPGRQ